MNELPRPNPWNLVAWGRLVLLFLKELALSTCMVLRVSLSPRASMRPAIVAVAVELRSRAGVLLLANLVGLTPGTVALHISEDRRTLYLHAMDAEGPEEVARDVREGFEAAMRKVLP